MDEEMLTCQALKEHERRNSHITIVDIRGENVWNKGHMKTAVHIPYGELKENVRKIVPNLHGPIVVCCSKGGRSKQAVKTLKKIGYTNVKYLDGGYLGYCQNS